MAMKHYDGRLGVFDYDDEEFVLKNDPYDDMKKILHYAGNETNGHNIAIPKGIKDCSWMFNSCESLVTAPEIPEGVENCEHMFGLCKNMIHTSLIPDGVKNCRYMFDECENIIDAPKIPDSVKNCEEMFSKCMKLVNAPEISNGVECCAGMFQYCENLINAPVIPESVKDCSFMFYGCRNLINAPKIPKSARRFNCDDMFKGCLEEVQKAGAWNIEHRDKDYYVDGPGTEISAKSKLDQLKNKLDATQVDSDKQKGDMGE